LYIIALFSVFEAQLRTEPSIINDNVELPFSCDANNIVESNSQYLTKEHIAAKMFVTFKCGIHINEIFT
jgi:hypothetical protein